MKIEHAIIIKNDTRLEQITKKFNTKSQAKFYIDQSQENFYSQTPEGKKRLEKKKGGKLFLLSSVVNKGKATTGKDSADNMDFADLEEENDLFYDSYDQIQRKLSAKLKTKTLERSFLPSYIFSKKDLIVVIGQDGLVQILLNM